MTASMEKKPVHSQVRRVLEEDMRIGDGRGEGLSAWDAQLIAVLHLNLFALSSKFVPRASPLGGLRG